MKKKDLVYGFLIVWGLLAICYAVAAYQSYIHKPAFYNHFGYNPEFPLLPVWIAIPSEVRDDVGNCFYADYKLNLFLATSPREIGDRPPIIRDGQVEVLFLNSKHIRFPFTRDSLIEVDENGIKRISKLSSGKARALFEAVQASSAQNRLPLLGSNWVKEKEHH